MIRVSPYWRRALRRIAIYGSAWHHEKTIESLPVYSLDVGLNHDWRTTKKLYPPFRP